MPTNHNWVQFHIVLSAAIKKCFNHPELEKKRKKAFNLRFFP